MDIINASFDDNFNFVIRINWIFAVVIISIIILCILLYRLYYKKKLKNKKKVNINSFKIGSKECSMIIMVDYSDIELAYKIWVEISTRKVGLRFDSQNDVIIEVFNSWYAFFGLTRTYLENLPGKNIKSSNDLVDLCVDVLNDGLRPALTKWQSRFRKWYELESKKEENKNKSPQEIEKKFPQYEELKKDLLDTNEVMLLFKSYLHDIAFDVDESMKSK